MQQGAGRKRRRGGAGQQLVGKERGRRQQGKRRRPVGTLRAGTRGKGCCSTASESRMHYIFVTEILRLKFTPEKGEKQPTRAALAAPESHWQPLCVLMYIRGHCRNNGRLRAPATAPPPLWHLAAHSEGLPSMACERLPLGPNAKG